MKNASPVRPRSSTRCRAPLASRRALLVGALALGCAARLGSGTARERSTLAGSVRVLTLNLAHGRGRSPVQSAVRGAPWYRRNLEVIARMLQRESADVVALQEAEGGSRWAGDFDHVEVLGRAAGYPFRVFDAHVATPGRHRYGTALLSRLPVIATEGHTFATQGRWAKGFSHATIETVRGPVSFASVHLDFASSLRRRRQAEEILSRVQAATQPQVWMGDFNDPGATTHDAIQTLLRSGDLESVDPDAVITHPGVGRRLDWILVSPGIDARSAHVLRDRLSDHRAVVADLAIP